MIDPICYSERVIRALIVLFSGPQSSSLLHMRTLSAREGIVTSISNPKKKKKLISFVSFF